MVHSVKTLMLHKCSHAGSSLACVPLFRQNDKVDVLSDRIVIHYRYKKPRILFVGINPHFGSFNRGVPFSNNKMFWYLLSDAGIIKEQRNELRDDVAPERNNTTATVHLDTENLRISAIDLDTKAQVPGINEQQFLEQAEWAKSNCIVSQALRGTEIRLQAKLAEAAK